MLESQKFAVFQLFYMCDTLINISVSITLKYRSNSSRINRWKMHEFYSNYAGRQDCYFFCIKSTAVLHTLARYPKCKFIDGISTLFSYVGLQWRLANLSSLFEQPHHTHRPSPNLLYFKMEF